MEERDYVIYVNGIKVMRVTAPSLELARERFLDDCELEIIACDEEQLVNFTSFARPRW